MLAVMGEDRIRGSAWKSTRYVVLVVLLLASPAHAACTIELTSADGRTLTLVVSQVVGVMDCPTCGGRTPTIVSTLNPTYWVRESAVDVVKKLDDALKAGCGTH